MTESVRLKIQLKPLENGLDRLVDATSAAVCRLANLDTIERVDERPGGVVTSVDPSFELFVELGRHVDLKAEVSRIEKEMAGLNKKLERASKKLINKEFLSNAPPEVVDKEKAKDAEMRDMLRKLDALREDYSA